MNETVEFTNLCMVRDGDRVLVIDRKKKDHLLRNKNIIVIS